SPRPSAIDLRFPRHILQASWTVPQVVSRIGTPRCRTTSDAIPSGSSSRSYDTRVSEERMAHRKANRRRTSPSSIVVSQERPAGATSPALRLVIRAAGTLALSAPVAEAFLLRAGVLGRPFLSFHGSRTTPLRKRFGNPAETSCCAAVSLIKDEGVPIDVAGERR